MLELAVIDDGLYKKSFAGDTFNVAHYLSTVTKGKQKVDYLTAVGHDADSDACLEFIEEKGVSTFSCQRDHQRTIGLFLLSNDKLGEKQYSYWRGQSAARHLFDNPPDLSEYDLIYFSGITVAITDNRENLLQSIALTKQHGAQIAYDFNYRHKLWTRAEANSYTEQLLPFVDIVKISDEELKYLYPKKEIADLSLKFSQAEWVLTCGGDKGEVWKSGKLKAQQQFTEVDKVIDSSAAGDAFIAAYIAEKLAGRTPADGLHYGHFVASQVVRAKGSIVPINLSKLD